MESRKCDVCLAPDSSFGVAASDIRAAARNGFDPVKLKLLPGPPGSLIPSLARAMWQMLLNEGDADWTFCARCMDALRPYLPPPPPPPPEPEPAIAEPVATGPDLLPEPEQLVTTDAEEPVEIIPEVSAAAGSLLEPQPPAFAEPQAPAEAKELAAHSEPAAAPEAAEPRIAPEEPAVPEEPAAPVAPGPAAAPEMAEQPIDAEARPEPVPPEPAPALPSAAWRLLSIADDFEPPPAMPEDDLPAAGWAVAGGLAPVQDELPAEAPEPAYPPPSPHLLSDMGTFLAPLKFLGDSEEPHSAPQESDFTKGDEPVLADEDETGIATEPFNLESFLRKEHSEPEKDESKPEFSPLSRYTDFPLQTGDAIEPPPPQETSGDSVAEAVVRVAESPHGFALAYEPASPGAPALDAPMEFTESLRLDPDLNFTIEQPAFVEPEPAQSFTDAPAAVFSAAEMPNAAGPSAPEASASEAEPPPAPEPAGLTGSGPSAEAAAADRAEPAEPPDASFDPEPVVEADHEAPFEAERLPETEDASAPEPQMTAEPGPATGPEPAMAAATEPASEPEPAFEEPLSAEVQREPEAEPEPPIEPEPRIEPDSVAEPETPEESAVEPDLPIEPEPAILPEQPVEPVAEAQPAVEPQAAIGAQEPPIEPELDAEAAPATEPEPEPANQPEPAAEPLPLVEAPPEPPVERDLAVESGPEPEYVSEHEPEPDHFSAAAELPPSPESLEGPRTDDAEEIARAAGAEAVPAHPVAVTEDAEDSERHWPMEPDLPSGGRPIYFERTGRAPDSPPEIYIDAPFPVESGAESAPGRESIPARETTASVLQWPVQPAATPEPEAVPEAQAASAPEPVEPPAEPPLLSAVPEPALEAPIAVTEPEPAPEAEAVSPPEPIEPSAEPAALHAEPEPANEHAHQAPPIFAAGSAPQLAKSPEPVPPASAPPLPSEQRWTPSPPAVSAPRQPMTIEPAVVPVASSPIAAAPESVSPPAPPVPAVAPLDLRSELRHCETLFFTFRFPQLVELSSQVIGQFPQCGDAYAYRSFAMLGEGRVDPQQAEAGELDALLRDYYRACTGSIATQGATVCRLFLKLIFADLVKRIRSADPGIKVRLQKSDPLCGGAFALLEGDFDRAQVSFDLAIGDPHSYAYACAGIGLLKLFQGDLPAARQSLARAGAEDEDIRMLSRSLAVPEPSPGVPPSAPPPAVFEGDAEQLARVLSVLDETADYKNMQFQQAGAKRGSDGKWETLPKSAQIMHRCIRQADQLWSVDFPALSKRLQLRGADLSGREFLGLRRTLALQKADLRNALLRNTSWQHINLDKSDFSDADLAGAQFVGVQCEQTTFRNAELPGALLDLASTIYPIDFSGANLAGARILFGRQFNDGAESFAPVRLHLTGANVEGLTVELVEPEAERAVESLQYLLSGLTPTQKARIQIVNAPVPEITKASGGRCFIATAAYGSACAYEVRLLRAWRDTVLTPSPLGRRFVRWYERTSPPIAAWIAPRPRARRLVRALLIRPVAALIRAFLDGVRLGF